MKIIKVIHILKLVTIGISITLSTASFQAAQARKTEKIEDDIPEIGWSSRITGMGLDQEENIDTKYQFDCQLAPDDLIHAPIWGTKFYTVNSGICSAAVHSGMIEAETGGQVTIKLMKGKNFYTGSNKYNVESEDHIATDMSFIFIGQKQAIVEKDKKEAEDKKREPSGIERILMDGFQRGVERTIDKAITDMLN